MDKYLLTIIGLIIFSIIVVLYVRISAKLSKSDDLSLKSEAGDDHSNSTSDRAFDDFTILE